MERDELIRDLIAARVEMDKLAASRGLEDRVPPYGVAMLGPSPLLDMIRGGQILPVSRRYLDAILNELNGV